MRGTRRKANQALVLHHAERAGQAQQGRQDQIRCRGGQRVSYYSRLEMTIRPYSSLHVLDLAAKGTIRNKEFFRRNHYQPLQEVDLTSFTELIDLWSLEYAELYAART